MHEFVAGLFFIAAALLVTAIRATPIKILDYRPGTDIVTLGCLHEGFAEEMARLSGGTSTDYVRVRKAMRALLLIVLAAAIAVMFLGY